MQGKGLAMDLEIWLWGQGMVEGQQGLISAVLGAVAATTPPPFIAE